MAGQAVHVITQITDDDRLVNGSVTLDGTNQQLGDAYCYDLIVQSPPSNAANVELGGENLVAGTNGIVLQPGDSIPISAQNISQVYVNGSAGEIVTFMYFTYRKAAQ